MNTSVENLKKNPKNKKTLQQNSKTKKKILSKKTTSWPSCRNKTPWINLRSGRWLWLVRIKYPILPGLLEHQKTSVDKATLGSTIQEGQMLSLNASRRTIYVLCLCTELKEPYILYSQAKKKTNLQCSFNQYRNSFLSTQFCSLWINFQL